MKAYPPMDALASRLNCDEKTVRKHIWKWIEDIGSIDVVRNAFANSLYWNHFSALTNLVEETCDDFDSDAFIVPNVGYNGEYVTDE